MPRAALPTLVLLAFTALACAREPAPVDRHFRLAAPEPALRLTTPGIAGTLVIDRPDGDALLAQRPIVFRPHADTRELAQHAYALWADVPTTMLQHWIALHLESAGVASQVLTADQGIPGDFRLRGRLVRFEHVLEHHAGVEVELELLLSHRETDELVLKGRYSTARTLDDGTMASVVDALQGALGEVMDDFVADLSTRTTRDGLLPVPARPAF